MLDGVGEREFRRAITSHPRSITTLTSGIPIGQLVLLPPHELLRELLLDFLVRHAVAGTYTHWYMEGVCGGGGGGGGGVSWWVDRVYIGCRFPRTSQAPAHINIYWGCVCGVCEVYVIWCHNPVPSLPANNSSRWCHTLICIEGVCVVYVIWCDMMP